jgi:hypothetical protein
MLLSVNITSPDYPDQEYVFDMYARPAVSTASGQLHRLGDRNVLQVSSIFEGSGCERMEVVSILASLQNFALGDTSNYPLLQFGRQFFGHTEGYFHTDVSVTFFHHGRYWSFGLSYYNSDWRGEWLYEEFPHEQMRAPVYHRWNNEDNLSQIEMHLWPEDHEGLPADILARLEAGDHAITLLATDPFPPAIRTAHEWLTEQLVIIGNATRKAALLRLVHDFKGFRRLCLQLLPVIGSEAIDVHYAEMTMLDFLNAYELNQDRGVVEEWTDPNGTLHWLYPNAFMALKIVDNQPVVIKLGFELPPEISEDEEHLQEFGAYPPPEDSCPPDTEAISNEQSPDSPGSDEEMPPPLPQTVFRIPFGALNPKLEDEEELFEWDGVDFENEDFEEDDFDFDDFDLSDLHSGFDDESPLRVSDNERGLIYRFPDFDLAMSDGKVVVWQDLRETTHAKITPVAHLLDYMIREGIAGQFLYNTRELDLIRSSVVRYGDLWYAPDGAENQPISWERINDALVAGNDASVLALLNMMFIPPAR